MSISIDFDFSELNGIAAEANQGLHAGITSAVKEACLEGAKEAVNSHVYQDRTAQLTASIHGDEFLIITPTGAEGQITAGEEYASYVNKWEQDNGSPGFMETASAKAEEVLQEGLARAVEDFEARLNK